MSQLGLNKILDGVFDVAGCPKSSANVKKAADKYSNYYNKIAALFSSRLVLYHI